MSVSGPLQRVLLLVDIAIFSLGIAALMAVLAQLFGGVVTVGGGVIGAVVTWFCHHRATRTVQTTWAFRLWRYAPSLLFVAFPLAYGAFIDDEGSSLLDLVFEYIEPLLTFVVPMICLALADWQLRAELARRSRQDASANHPPNKPEIELADPRIDPHI